MIIVKSYEEIIEKLKNGRKYTFIDVRSPSEYSQEHIPGAINIPVFSDKEREHIGTLYKREGRKVAIREAVGIVGVKIKDIYESFERYVEKESEIAVYCARGGMRSSTVVSLFKVFSLPIIKLEGGYKGYRRFLNENLHELVKSKEFIVIYGRTGSGKTEILKKIAQKGYDVLDLEKCANHRGSLLGGIGLGETATQKNFESGVLDALLFSKSDKIIVEGESRRIGNIVMPAYLYQKMTEARKLYIETDISRRVDIIREDYLKEGFRKEEITESLEKLGKYIGEKNKNAYIEGINAGKFDEVIKDLMENYYDKVYKIKDYVFERTFFNREEEECAEEIIEYIFKP